MVAVTAAGTLKIGSGGARNDHLSGGVRVHIRPGARHSKPQVPQRKREGSSPSLAPKRSVVALTAGLVRTPPVEQLRRVSGAS